MTKIVTDANGFDLTFTVRDTYDDVRRVSKEIWGGRRSFFLSKLGPGEEDNTLVIDFILHLDMEIRDDISRFETRDRRDGFEQGF